MMELLQWLDHLNAVKNLVMAPKSANLLLIAYFLVYIFNRKSCFIVAFLLTEFYGNSFISDGLSDVNFYLCYSLFYIVLYFKLIKEKETIQTITAVVLIIILDAGSAIDAWIYPKDETIFYQTYQYLYILVHVFLIITLIRWRTLWGNLGVFIDAITRFFHISYAHKFF